MTESIKPYKDNQDKKAQVESMFDNISHSYDFLNHFLSIGIDKRWRKKLLSFIKEPERCNMLDVACGTGDIAIKAARELKIRNVAALDLSQKMLDIAAHKVHKYGLQDGIEFFKGESENIPFQDGQFNVLTCGFGVRNFGNLHNGLKEMYRVLKPGGKCLILEFSQPRRFPIAQLYHIYFKYVLPVIGKAVSADGKAYRYLYDSAMAFPSFTDFTTLLKEIGFSEAQYQALTSGICCIYYARK